MMLLFLTTAACLLITHPAAAGAAPLSVLASVESHAKTFIKYKIQGLNIPDFLLIFDHFGILKSLFAHQKQV